jgi:hypothetical protein
MVSNIAMHMMSHMPMLLESLIFQKEWQSLIGMSLLIEA